MKLHDRPLAFIGPMGSGKSSLARRVSAKYGGEVIDIDKEFTRRYGSISDFFAQKGEQAFRELEQNLLVEAAGSGAAYISTGGGAVLGRRGMYALRKTCTVVYLTAPIEVLKERISRSDRPLKNDLERTVEARAPLYEKYADYTIDTSVDSVRELERALKSKRKNRYDVLLCDSDDTLLDFQKARSVAIRAAAEKFGLPCGADECDRAYKSVVCKVWHRLERGEITGEKLKTERFVELGKALGIEFDVAAFNEAYTSEMIKTRFVLDGATEFLQAVRERGIKRYIITNSFTNFANERLKPILPFVDGAFVSEQVGYYKPDVRFFDSVCRAIGEGDRSRILVFGDSETSDIKGGTDSGLDTCRLVSAPNACTDADYAVCGYGEVLDIL